MEYFNINIAVQALEAEVIYPNLSLKPSLIAIIKRDAPEDDKSFLRAIKAGAKKYKVDLQVREVDNDYQCSQEIMAYRVRPSTGGIILLSDFGATVKALGSMIPTLVDIDCSSAITIGLLIASDSEVGYRLAPCFAISCYKLLEHTGVGIAGKHVAVIGRSRAIGRPLAEILLQHDASVSIFHSKSKNIDLSPYDIVISTVGKPKTIDSSWWKHGFKTKCLIDAGYHEVEDEVIGDIDLKGLEDKDFIINRIKPNDLGRLTTTVLFAKLYANALGRIPEAMKERGVGHGKNSCS